MMKNYMKITGVIAVLVSNAGTVKAGEALKKDDTLAEDACQKSEGRECGYAMLGKLLSTAQKYLTDEENTQIKNLIGEGWKRKNMSSSQKTYKDKP